MQRFETRRVPPLGGFNLTFIALEIRRLLRNRRTVVITIVVPAVLVLIFNNGAVKEARGTQLQASLMIGVAVYGAMLGSTAGGAMVSVERALGWSRQLRLTPLRPPAYIAIKLITAMFLGLASVVVVSVVGGLIGASVVTESWFLAALLSWVGGLVYAAFGLFMGYLLPSENVMQLISPVLAIFALVGGLFVPLSLLPSTVRDIAPFTPTYGVAAIAREPLLGTPFDWTWVLNVAVWTAIFALGAAVMFRRDTQRT